MKTLAILSLLAFAAPAFAERIEASVTDVTPVYDGQGSARILFRAGPTQLMEDVAIRKATLRWSPTASGERQRVTLQVYLVTTPWSAEGATWGAGGEFEQGLYGRREVELGTGEAVSVDLTSVFKEILEHGVAAQGFVLTVDSLEGDGLLAADVERLGLSGATLEVQYRNMPPMRPGRRDG